jgi:hypothetical protein
MNTPWVSYAKYNISIMKAFLGAESVMRIAKGHSGWFFGGHGRLISFLHLSNERIISLRYQ